MRRAVRVVGIVAGLRERVRWSVVGREQTPLPVGRWWPEMEEMLGGEMGEGSEAEGVGGGFCLFAKFLSVKILQK